MVDLPVCCFYIISSLPKVLPGGLYLVDVRQERCHLHNLCPSLRLQTSKIVVFKMSSIFLERYPDKDLNIPQHEQFSWNPSRTPRPLFAPPQTLGGTPPPYSHQPAEGELGVADGTHDLTIWRRQTKSSPGIFTVQHCAQGVGVILC